MSETVLGDMVPTVADRPVPQGRLDALRYDPKAVKWARMAAQTYLGRPVTDEWIVGIATGGYVWLLVADTLMGEMGLRRL